MMTAYGNPVYDDIVTPWIATRGRVLSGCSINAALAYAKLGGKAHVIGSIGDDYRDHYHTLMRSYGIDCTTEKSEETGGFRLDYDEKGNRTLKVLGRAEPIGSGADLASDSEFVLVGPVLQETPFELIRDVRDRFQGPMLLDPQGLLRRLGPDGQVEHFKPSGIEEICALFDYVKPNELEARILTGIDPRVRPEDALDVLLEWGIPNVVITLAELGAIAGDGRETYGIGAVETLAVDSTGAGDTFAAGLMFALGQGDDLETACGFASTVSSIMIEQCGPQFVLNEPMARARMERLAMPAVMA